MLIRMNLDIWYYIGKTLDTDINRCNLMATCRSFLKLGLELNNEQTIQTITKLIFFDNFTNIVVDFKSEIIKKFPKKIHKLEYKETILKEHIKIIPNGITHLFFHKPIEFSLVKYIPHGITHLNFDYRLVNGKCIPSSVVHLILGKCNDMPFIPSSVTYLEMYNDYDLDKKSIPNTIKHLFLGKLSKKIVPSLVTHLRFDDCHDKFADCIPSSVKYIEIGGFPSIDPFNDCLPSSVTHLVFDIWSSSLLPNIIPSSVTHLVIGGCYNKTSKKLIPTSVTHLFFGNLYNHVLKGNIPSSVTHLVLGMKFNKPLDIPESVTHLTIHEDYKGAIPKGIFINRQKRFNMPHIFNF